MMSLFWVWLLLEHVEDMADISNEFSLDSVIKGHHIYKKYGCLQLEKFFY